MTRGVLLDTNLLIGAFDDTGSTSEEQRAKAKEQLTTLLSDPYVALAITPLIRYEVLRGISLQEDERFEQMKRALGGFEEFDIGRDVSELAANLFRFDRNEVTQSGENRNIEKRKFDVFHLASAECNALELASDDSDISKLKSLHDRFIESINHNEK
ncbi:type II toxin-antitoxin system VapC family toxin [Leucothrix pacifica]|uniref:PIN domain-containing protein n=1 Tax=Leucothrix pacifica TaxID=1247513 RepID=A0A317CGP9_9GAMM|nr:PIN domain-containing protein [Leucothrix pacifica]PWQ96603.1 PIN domain-containing protein [Leucothrix pacifica]